MAQAIPLVRARLTVAVDLVKVWKVLQTSHLGTIYAVLKLERPLFTLHRRKMTPSVSDSAIRPVSRTAETSRSFKIVQGRESPLSGPCPISDQRPLTVEADIHDVRRLWVLTLVMYYFE